MGYFGDLASALLGFIPGLLGLGLLLTAGLSRQQCFLVIRPLSRVGFAVLGAVFLFALAAILPVSVWQGWSWQAALVYAPASGISQELFFRSVLLPTMQRVLKRRDRSALIAHSMLFGLWHIGPLFLGAPLWAVLLVMLVPFLSGLGWGWQVMRDRTVVWAMVQHSLIWVIALQFAQPG
jgi:membrane protease YdiL (CAAX protease family)